MNFRNITLELSLKPFFDPSPATAELVCRKLFQQWSALLTGADQVSVMFWSADGSEILDYRGDLEATFEWDKWVGVANPRRPLPPEHPHYDSFHNIPRLYRENPPEFTYGWFRDVVATVKRVGRQVTGLPVRIGATFDPGPEFAVSSFKYERHPEVCMGDTMGQGSMICCYAELDADEASYAGFPEGIPAGTPFGTFLGRQSKCFCEELGFDFLWLSNGFGFGLETWGLRGAIFDGKAFSPERREEVRAKSMVFWETFRRECPDLPLETRGTNLSTGMDLSSDAVPLREIYRTVSGLMPPPNSPWAALNGDFGLELTGWMSHIAELPGEEFPYRFYTHDPWFLNSPWLDRYQREAHDIFLPLSVSRINAKGETCVPTTMNFLSVDDSYGELPDEVPNEVTPHILRCRGEQPDQPGPLVWVYPFDEYSDWTFGESPRLEEVFFGDWFMRGAVNHGLPLNTVVSTGTFAQLDPGIFAESILVSPVPDADTAWETALFRHLERGGKALLYGPLERASAKLVSLLGVELDSALDGDFDLELGTFEDRIETDSCCSVLRHYSLFSAGGLCAAPDAGGRTHLAVAKQDGKQRVAATVATCASGQLGWVRGTVACKPTAISGHLLVPYSPKEAFPAEMLMRLTLSELGLRLQMEKISVEQTSPMVCVSRHDNGFVFAGYNADTTAALRLRFPQGMPVFLDYECRILEGTSRYTLPKSWRKSCRVFIEQEDGGPISARTRHSGHPSVKERMEVKGLQQATVRFYPKKGTWGKVKMTANAPVPCLGAEEIPLVHKQDGLGDYLEAVNVSGMVMISW